MPVGQIESISRKDRERNRHHNLGGAEKENQREMESPLNFNDFEVHRHRPNFPQKKPFNSNYEAKQERGPDNFEASELNNNLGHRNQFGGARD